ncbi:MAG: COX15/CtaA family protein [Proteobacteria bacterium]|nr:COX15/CtaA family protein [Pseudomonadota bacterium]
MSTDKPNANAKADRVVAWWLFSVAAMVAVMVVIGGITRLTESGLSMVEWRPLIGWLPPMSEEQWIRTFALYQNSPQYLKVNAWMGLEDFRRIFWWEYTHRLWGRLIGLAFALPFLWFVVRGMVRRDFVARIVLLFALGGLQGGIGWWMVKSGLSDDPAVSQYRLTVHLAMAFLILGALFWVGLDLVGAPRHDAPKALRRHAWAALSMVSLTVVAGAMVAGLDAGLIYNTFPLMDGGIVPPDYGNLSPVWLNAVENAGAVQFHHRVLAILTVLVVVSLLFRVMRSGLASSVRLPVHVLAAMVLVQTTLGIATLIFVVPLDLAAAHQAGAVVLFSAAVWVVFGLRGSVPSR